MANTTGRKYGGRKKGTPNKEVKKLRERIDSLLDDNWEQILVDIKELSQKERIDTYTRLLEYSIPKLSRAENTNDNHNTEIRIIREVKK